MSSTPPIDLEIKQVQNGFEAKHKYRGLFVAEFEQNSTQKQTWAEFAKTFVNLLHYVLPPEMAKHIRYIDTEEKPGTLSLVSNKGKQNG